MQELDELWSNSCRDSSALVRRSCCFCCHRSGLCPSPTMGCQSLLPCSALASLEVLTLFVGSSLDEELGVWAPCACLGSSEGNLSHWGFQLGVELLCWDPGAQELAPHTPGMAADGVKWLLSTSHIWCGISETDFLFALWCFQAGATSMWASCCGLLNEVMGTGAVRGQQAAFGGGAGPFRFTPSTGFSAYPAPAAASTNIVCKACGLSFSVFRKKVSTFPIALHFYPSELIWGLLGDECVFSETWGRFGQGGRKCLILRSQEITVRIRSH